LGAIFVWVFRNFAGIFRDFAQIFDKSKLLEVHLHSTSYTTSSVHTFPVVIITLHIGKYVIFLDLA